MRPTTVRTGFAVVCFCCCFHAMTAEALKYQAPGETSKRTTRQESISLEAIKRIYVEPFDVKNGSTKLRRDVVAQLRKLNNITIVPDISKAEAILTGEGEIWVRSYQSLNPRSGHLPYDGKPIYSGFLSVELRDVNGDTLWSYLVTPGPPSGEITKELSRRLEKQLAQALDAHGTGTQP